MKEYMSKFTDLANDANAIEKLFEELYRDCKGNKKKEKALYDILENQMWKSWRDKTIDTRTAYLYKRLMDRMEN